MSEIDPRAAINPPPSANTAIALHQPYRIQTAVERQAEEQSADDSLTLADLLRIIQKHKWTLLAVVLLACAVSAVRTFLSTPIYRSTVILQIERQAPRVVSFNNEAEREPGWGGDEMTMLRTQYELLRSRSLAERVIDELRLDQSRAAAAPGAAQDGAAVDAGTEAGAASAPNGIIERVVSGYQKLSKPTTRNTETLAREGVVQGFLQSVTVEPVRSSRLVKLHVDNTDPQLAARIANATAQSYIAMGLERRLEASSYAKTFLEEQIKQMKAKLEESERRLNKYAQEKEILTLDEKTNVVNQTYTDYASALAKAEQDRIKIESLYAEIQRSPETVSLVSESKSFQTYKEQKAKLEIEYQQNLRIYKPDFPKMQQIKAQIMEAENQIKAEVTSVASGVKAQYDAAVRQERLIRDRLKETRRQVLTTQDSSIDLNLLKREVDTNRQLYDGLLQRLKQLGVTGDAITNNISVVDAAEPPIFPFKPDLRRNVLLGLAAGLFLGLCLVALLEYLDDSIKMPEEVERYLGVPLMGIIPKIARKRGDGASVAMEVHADPRSTLAEAYRSVRTALQFSTPEGAPKRLVVTSTTRNEGKSTSALALAINFAQMGQRVLLIDADMRNPSVHKLLGMPNDVGLSNLLSSDSRGEKMIVRSQIPNLSVLTAGPVPPNPVDLLMGPKLLLLLNVTQSLGIDYVIVDAPPLLGIADSVVLGNHLQNLLFVVQASSTRKSHIKNALRRLRIAGLVPRGVILTQTLRGSLPQDYESYYGYGPAENLGGKTALADAR